MESNYKDLVDKNYMLVTELLRSNIVSVIRYLYDEQILKEPAATKTISQTANTLKVMHLLDNMLKLGPEAFDSLYAAILYAKLWRAADLLEPKKRPHQPIQKEEEEDLLPKKWPDECCCKEFSITKVESDDVRMKEWYEQSKKNNIYEMKKEIKGRALIINNNQFKPLHMREGSKKDLEDIKKLFAGLAFEPDPHEDLTCAEMAALLQEECRKDHTDYNCFFLIIMTHGEKGVVYGTDGYKAGGIFHNSLKIEDIKNQFYQVKSLERKPKVFIIQACQGYSQDSGVKARKVRNEDDEEEDEEDPTDGQTHHDGTVPSDDENQAVDVGNQAADDGNLAVDVGNQAIDVENQAVDDENQAVDDENQAADVGNQAVDGDNEGGNELAGDDDPDGDSDDDESEEEGDRQVYDDSLTAEAPFHFLVAMSTTPGNWSYRNKRYGGWFIQAVVYVFANFSYKEHLLTLMEKVNELMRRAKTVKDKRSPMEYMQVSEITETLTKNFFFFPGMPLETKEKKKPFMPTSAMTSALNMM